MSFENFKSGTFELGAPFFDLDDTLAISVLILQTKWQEKSKIQSVF